MKVLQDKMAASQKHHDSVQQDLSARIADLEGLSLLSMVYLI